MTASTPPPDEHAQDHGHDHGAREGLLALRNGAKLAASMILTWGVALIVTFKLPKYLGPERFGHYRFGDQFAMSLAVFLSLGVDTYISREIAVRPKHASEFFGGVLVTRALVILPLVVVAFFFLDGEVHERRIAAVLFGFAYLFTALNQTFQQTLQAASKVDGLAIANVVAKVLWGGGTFAAVTHAGAVLGAAAADGGRRGTQGRVPLRGDEARRRPRAPHRRRADEEGAARRLPVLHRERRRLARLLDRRRRARQDRLEDLRGGRLVRLGTADRAAVRAALADHERRAHPDDEPREGAQRGRLLPHPAGAASRP